MLGNKPSPAKAGEGLGGWPPDTQGMLVLVAWHECWASRHLCQGALTDSLQNQDTSGWRVEAVYEIIQDWRSIKRRTLLEKQRRARKWHMAKQKQDEQPELTYSSYVRTQDVTQKTCRRRWTIGKSGKRWSRISVLAARHDDDDDNIKSTYPLFKREKH